jgi:5-bromo-4-chloroindolyl phosphate hydrolysis protein
MEMEEFVKGSVANFKEVFSEDRLHDHEYTYIARTLEAAKRIPRY